MEGELLTSLHPRIFSNLTKNRFEVDLELKVQQNSRDHDEELPETRRLNTPSTSLLLLPSCRKP